MTMSEPAPRGSGAIIGENITLMLFRKKMTQRDLAHRAGMTAATLSRKMHGERQWSIDELVAVSAALGVSAVQLLPLLDSTGGSVDVWTDAQDAADMAEAVAYDRLDMQERVRRSLEGVGLDASSDPAVSDEAAGWRARRYSKPQPSDLRHGQVIDLFSRQVLAS